MILGCIEFVFRIKRTSGEGSVCLWSVKGGVRTYNYLFCKPFVLALHDFKIYSCELIINNGNDSKLMQLRLLHCATIFRYGLPVMAVLPSRDIAIHVTWSVWSSV